MVFIGLWLSAFGAFSQTTPEKLKAITDRSKWNKASQSIHKAITKDSLEPAYLMALFYFNDKHPTFQVDSASLYLDRSARLVKTKERNKRSIPDSTMVTRLRSSIDSAAFERAKQTDTEDAYQFFITKYPTAPKISAAVELRDEQAFLKALKANTSLSFGNFIARYPNSHRKPEAKSRMERLQFDEVTHDKRLASYEKFYREFPRNPFRPFAERKIFELLTAQGSAKSFQRFISAYPESRWVGRARVMMFSLQRDGEVVADGSWKTDSLRRESHRSAGYWAPVIKSGLYGFIDETGKEVVSPRFKEIPEGYRCGEITDRYLVTSAGLLARNSHLVWKGKIKDFDDLGLGFIFVATDSGGFVIHESGFRPVATAVDDAIVIANRFLGINQNDKWSVLTLSGFPLLQSAYDDIAALDSVIQLTKDRKRILTTPARIARMARGMELKEDFVCDDTRKWGDQQYWVRNGILEGVVDANLNFIIPLDRQVLRKTSFGFLTTKAEKTFIKGVKKLEGKPYKQIVEQGGYIRMKDEAGKHWVYDKAFGWLVTGDSAWFQGQVAFMQHGDSVHVYLPAGQKVTFLKGSYFQFKEFRDSAAWMVVEEKKKKVVYDAASGIKMFTGEFDNLEPISKDLFVFTRLNKKGMVREDGKLVLLPEYDAIVAANDHSYSLLKDKKFGWYDAQSKTLIKPGYDRNVKPYKDKLFLAFKDNGYGFVLSDGKSLGLHDWEDIQYWSDSAAWVKKGGVWKLLDIASQRIKLDNVKSYQLQRDGSDKIALVQQDKAYGIISSRRGVVIPIQYTDIINLGTQETPLYFTERHFTDADISVVVYFDQHGKIVRRQAMEADEFEKIACEN
jgi:hypothetical protein